MIEAIMNLLLIVLAATVTGIWIAALADYDGKCDEENCEICPFPDDCPIKKMREETDG